MIQLYDCTLTAVLHPPMVKPARGFTLTEDLIYAPANGKDDAKRDYTFTAENLSLKRTSSIFTFTLSVNCIVDSESAIKSIFLLHYQY
jgi:hypothetical protein